MDEISTDQQRNQIQKITMMGCKGVGKTSMRTIIFGFSTPIETKSLSSTLEIISNHIDLLGTPIQILDCGGQETLKNEYFNQKAEEVFSNLKVFVFVIEAEKISEEEEKYELDFYEKCVEKVNDYSPNSKIFVLINKIDLIHDTRKNQVVSKRKKQIINISGNFKVVFFLTSVWDDSLFIAWQEITSSLLFDRSKIAKNLEFIGLKCLFKEIMLFDPLSFLIFSYYSRDNIKDDSRFSKISKVCKRIYLSCFNSDYGLTSFVYNCKNFYIVFEKFVPKTYILVVVDNLNIKPEFVSLNIAILRKEYSNLFEQEK